jgi:hypothetical protein
MVANDCGYASVVTSQPPTRQWAPAFLVALAVVFAPAPDEEPLGPVRGAEDSVDARILAPTVRQGIVDTGPKLSTRHLQIADQRSRLGPISLTLASGAAVVLLASVIWSARRKSRAAPRFVALRARVPRGPPTLLTA